MDEIMSGQATPAQIGAFITGLRMKGETVEEITGAARTMRAKATKIQVNREVVSIDRDDINIEDEIISVSEIFRIQGADELKDAEKKYLPTSGKTVNSIILAASQGSLGELTKETPKTLLKVKDKSLLDTQIENFNKVGIKDITVVRGFKKEKIYFP